MRRLVRGLLALTFVVAGSAAFAGKVGPDCTLKGHKLWGKIEFVDHFPDLKIQIVDHFPDLRVQKVEHFPDQCGRWQVVKHFPDLKVQVVKHFPDLRVKYVDHFPGVGD